MVTKRQDIVPEEKLRIVLEAVARPGDPLQSFLDREGVTVQQLHHWYQLVEAAALKALKSTDAAPETSFGESALSTLETELTRVRKQLKAALDRLEELGEQVRLY